MSNFGFMRSRKEGSIRFTLEGVQFNKLIETMIALGWQGDYDALRKLQQTCLKAINGLCFVLISTNAWAIK